MNAFRRLHAVTLFAAVALTSVVGVAAPAHTESVDGLKIVEVDVAGHPTVQIMVKTPAELVGRVLDGAAFAVTEGGEKVDVVAEPVSTQGLEVVLVVDTSGSMKGAPIDGARHAAATFVQSLPAGTPVSVIGFGATPTVAAPFTTDVATLTGAIGGLKASGETALNDALVKAAADLAGRPAARRSVVVLSDGGDTVSAATLDTAIERLSDAKATVHVVELLSAETDHAALARIADASGGSLVGAADPGALEAAYREVTADLVSRYRLTYTSTKAGTVEVAVTLTSGDITASVADDIVYPGTAAASLGARDVDETDGPGLLGSDFALVLGAVCIFLAIAGLGISGFRPTRRRVTLSPKAAAASATPTGLRDLATQATAFTERTLAKHDQSRSIDTMLEQAGILLRPAEFVLIVVVATAGAAAFGLLLGGILVALVLAAIGPVAGRLFISVKRDRRRDRFADQLDDLLTLVASSLRAGYGLQQALESASTELMSPTADELRRLTTEVRLGRDLGDCLDAMAVRVGNEDFGWVAQAIRIHREVGGDLSEVLDRVSETIRARNHVKRQVKALSAEGRMSAYVLFALPLGLAAMISVTNPEYIGGLFSTGLGLAMVGMGVVLMTVGALWLRKLVRIVY